MSSQLSGVSGQRIWRVLQQLEAAKAGTGMCLGQPPIPEQKEPIKLGSTGSGVETPRICPLKIAAISKALQDSQVAKPRPVATPQNGSKLPATTPQNPHVLPAFVT